MSLRARLALTYAILLIVALTASGVSGYLIAARRIYGSVDDSLRIRAQEVTEALEPLGDRLSSTEVAENQGELDDLASADLIFQVTNAGGEVLYSSSQSFSRSLPSADGRVAGAQGFATENVRGQDVRILYEPITRGVANLGTVEVAESLSRANGALNEIRDVLLVSGLIAALLTTLSAYTVAGRALRPVRQLSQLAREIQETANFSRRLPAPGTKGEVPELINTFNAMIERVELTLLHQKSFLADSSHELRRPLTVLRTNIDVLKNPQLPSDERMRCIEEMREEAEAMSRLLSDLLLLAREESQAIERTHVDFSRLCQRAVERSRSQHPDRQWHAKVQDGIEVLGDSERLAQMVGNLLENAAQYTRAAGEAELTLRLLDGRARLSVSDTGAGIDPADLPHLFDRFYRGSAARAARPDGLGLGLAIVRFTAEAHGGSVSVSSEPGTRTSFVVDIPVIRDPAPD